MSALRMTTLCLLWAASLHASAQTTNPTVWRCGPDGRSYESQPCKDGRAIDVPGARPEADVLAARRVAEADQRLAQQLRDERLQRERELLARGPGLVGIGRATPNADVKPRQDRPEKAKSTASKMVPVRQARSPEAGGTSPRAARASPRTPG
jgi:hypothetical protein